MGIVNISSNTFRGRLLQLILISVVGNNWLVKQFSEKRKVFCMKLGDYKGRKVTESDF